jgi:hypothetical protein
VARGPGALRVLGALTIAFALIGAFPSLLAAPGGGGAGAPKSLLVPGNCTGRPMNVSNVGTLEVFGSFPSTPSVANVSVALDYRYGVEISTGSTHFYECLPGSTTFVTGTHGAFEANASIPSDTCDRTTCTTYSGPFQPAYFSYPGKPPAGFYFVGAYDPSAPRPELVAAVQNLTLAPAGPLVLSVGAPTEITLEAMDALGAPSEASFAVSWRLPNGNWTDTGGPGRSTNITGETDDSPAVLTATVNATYAGVRLPTRSVNEEVNALATRITYAAPAATSVDAGTPVGFTVLGTGAVGYAYRATLWTGFENTSVSQPCNATPAAGGSVVLGCALSVSYTEAGTATPSVEVTNGFSSASQPFANLTIGPALALVVTPSPPRMYVDTPTVLDAGVVAGTGTEPYGPACLSDGTGAIQCATTAGPAWSFTLEYPRPGSYPGAFTVVDGSGANRSLAFPIEVGRRPSLTSVSASTGSVAEGSPVELAGSVAGGVGPLAYWWNASAPAGTIAAGTLAAPGSFNVSYVPRSPGAVSISLTVVDALGTVVAGNLTLEVLPGPAVTLAPAAGVGLAPAVIAGAPAPFRWEALSPDGLRVPEYAEPLTLTFGPLPTGGGAVTIDPLRGGPEPLPPNGSLTLGASDWQDGYLNFSVTTTRSGAYSVALGTPLGSPLAPGGTLTFTVAPDAAALVLVDPHVALAGGRTNHTEWFLEDTYGNPGPATPLNLTLWFGGTAVSSPLPVATNGSATWTWVNLSAPGTGAGSYEVRSATGELLLGPISVPAAPGPTDVPLWALAGAGVLLGSAAIVVTLLRLRSARPRRPVEADLEELAEHARGREALLERIRREGPLDLEAIRRGRPGAREDRAEVAEWLASLTTEGLVTTEPGPGGVPRFRAAARPPAPPGPRVDLDEEALDRALRARDPPEE